MSPRQSPKSIRVMCVLAALMVAPSAYAGRAAPAVQIWHRPVVAGSRVMPRPLTGLPPLAGIIHQRAGRPPTFTAFGHVATQARYGRAFPTDYIRGYGRRRFVYRTKGDVHPRIVNGFEGTRGSDRRRAYYAGSGGYSPSNYASADGEAYAEPPLDVTYGEASLARPYGDSSYVELLPPSSAPQIVEVQPSDRTGRGKQTCSCRPDAGGSPMVYRYGVGSAE